MIASDHAIRSQILPFHIPNKEIIPAQQGSVMWHSTGYHSERKWSPAITHSAAETRGAVVRSIRANSSQILTRLFPDRQKPPPERVRVFCLRRREDLNLRRVWPLTSLAVRRTRPDYATSPRTFRLTGFKAFGENPSLCQLPLPAKIGACLNSVFLRPLPI